MTCMDVSRRTPRSLVRAAVSGNGWRVRVLILPVYSFVLLEFLCLDMCDFSKVRKSFGRSPEQQAPHRGPTFVTLLVNAVPGGRG